jgi:transposase
MSLRFKSGLRVLVYSESIDMRWGFSRLQALVSEQMKENLFEGHVFVFLGRNRRRAKLLLFDGTGLVLIIKRLDRARFMAIGDLCETREITHEELARLIDGANLRVVFAAAKRVRENQTLA